MGKKEHNAACVFGAAYLLGQLLNLENHLEAARTNSTDIEPVHQLRVTSRRLRTGVKHFRTCLPDKKTRQFEDEIRRLGSALGKARDLDIQIDTLNALYDDQLDPKFKPAYRRLLLRLKQKRMKRQEKIEQTLEEIQEKRILGKMKERLEEAAAGAENLYLFTPSLYERSFAAIHADLEDLLSYEKFVDSPENMEKLHAMRIAGKHLRYSMEIFSPVYKAALIPYIQFMKDIQNQLGRMHDDDVWVNWLPKFLKEEEARVKDYFGNTGPLKRLLPGIDHLVEDRKRSREKAYQSFLSTWKTLTRENAWDNLQQIIKAPLSIESAMKRLAEEEPVERTAAQAPESVKTDPTGKETPETTTDEVASHQPHPPKN
jgi:CHAD domain-containing protein